MDSNSWEVIDSSEYAKNPNNQSINKEEGEEDEINIQEQSSNRYGQNVKNYETEWRDLCMMVSSEPDLKKLRTIAINGDLKISKFRSIIWNILLGALTNNPAKWVEMREKQRRQYFEIKKKHVLDPTCLKVAEEQDNPLSQSKGSLWNQHFRDTELRNLIQQDVVRTNPNVDFYRKEHIQEIMINILFCYAREYPFICYRQGMHEILAPLIFVLHCDHQSFGHIQEETSIELDPILVAVLDPTHIEEDSYHLFCHLMNSLELFYRVNDMAISESGQLTNIPKDPDSPQSQDQKSSEIEVVHQLNMVRDKIFAKYDLHLHNHLLKLEIPLALFGIRWLRLLFGREFNLLDLLMLWDAIFGIGDNLKFTYYIVVAMLIHIRDRLLSNDYTTCLTLLMRYPINVDVGLIVRHALYMCEPDKYQCPPNAFVYVISSMKQRQISAARVYQQRVPGSPRRVTTKQPTAVQKKPQSEDGVVDGFLLDDPNVLKMELNDAYSLMSVTRLKLLQYLSVLRKHIPGNQVDELHQTLDGIEELCSLLKPQHEYLLDDGMPVEAAFEADDDDFVSIKPERSFPIAKKVNTGAAYEMPNNKVSRAASHLLQKNRREVEMNLIRSSVLGCVDDGRYPQENPIAECFDSD